MSLMTRIAGQSGERLCSLLLLYLIHRSPEMRDVAINLFSERSEGSQLLSWNRFSVESEVYLVKQSESRPDERGLVDILIELDNAVVGVEVKLDAHFMDGQPAKYLPPLKKRAELLAAARNESKYFTVLVVLAPARRSQEIREHIESQGIHGQAWFVAWEELLDRLSGCNSVDAAAVFLRDELRAYVENAIGVRKDFPRLLPGLRKNFPEGVATHEQASILGWVWKVFRPSDGGIPALKTRLSTAQKNTTYAGYFFLNSRAGEGYGWYGFLGPGWIAGAAGDTAKDSAIFVVITDFDVPGLDKARGCKRITIDPTWHRGVPVLHAWAVNFDRNWDRLDVWEDALKPLRSEVFARISRAEAELNPEDGA